MKRRFIAAIAAAILTVSCVASVSAERCPDSKCPGTLEGYGCTMPELKDMIYQMPGICHKHTGCKLTVYYAYSKALCSKCGTPDDEALTHPCAISHQVDGSVYSCCQYW